MHTFQFFCALTCSCLLPLLRPVSPSFSISPPLSPLSSSWPGKTNNKLSPAFETLPQKTKKKCMPLNFSCTEEFYKSICWSVGLPVYQSYAFTYKSNFSGTHSSRVHQINVMASIWPELCP